ncbi:hypothetical protein [Microbacterium sp. 77mftsu3.1]|uniref:hypothetical protein n=1 Tax=Microbacterium sp. 77mftsu3.1 TaxID=1761802 RepID=UPI000369EA3B|nr:hypothetical protein [Microbacterium sp. 77mftsu3.1]SDH51052.1 hypothetical protein SAMN04488590_3483 [Microbacterium sp. 77mftsu3.1]
MANPFLVLGGIAVGIITAAFGVLAVPGWVASAQDASAKNDIAQITIGQSASLSATGAPKATIAAINSDGRVGVSITTQATIDADARTAVNGQDFATAVKSASGKVFIRMGGGPIRVALSSVTATPTTHAAMLTAYNAGSAG